MLTVQTKLDCLVNLTSGITQDKLDLVEKKALAKSLSEISPSSPQYDYAQAELSKIKASIKQLTTNIEKNSKMAMVYDLSPPFLKLEDLEEGLKVSIFAMRKLGHAWEELSQTADEEQYHAQKTSHLEQIQTERFKQDAIQQLIVQYKQRINQTFLKEFKKYNANQPPYRGEALVACTHCQGEGLICIGDLARHECSKCQGKGSVKSLEYRIYLGELDVPHLDVPID